MAELPQCEAPDCIRPATTTLSGQASTLRGLGFTVVGDAHMTARVCTYCYLKCMETVLQKAKLPKDTQAVVEYWCETCGKVVSPVDVQFVAGHAATPFHYGHNALVGAFSPTQALNKHAIKIRVVK